MAVARQFAARFLKTLLIAIDDSNMRAGLERD